MSLEDPDDFLQKVRELDLQRQREDTLRRSQLQSDIQLINPVQRHVNIPHSDSVQRFNSSVSSEYKINDDLTYESAYNYEKSGRLNSPKKSNGREDNADGEMYTPSLNKSSYQKYNDMDIIKFEDFITKSPYMPKSSTSSRPSRYSKFQLSEDERSQIDRTLEGLIGRGSSSVPDMDSDKPLSPPALTRQRKGGSLHLSSPSIASPANNEWSSQAKSKPVPQPPSNLKKSPQKFQLNESLTPSSPAFKSTSPIKKSPAKLNITDSLKPEVKPKPKHWLNSALENSTTTSTTQSELPNPSKKLDFVNGFHKQTSWLQSAQEKNSSNHELPPTKCKLPPIKPSKSNTLQKIMENNQQSQLESVKTLKELENTKLNHIDDDPQSKPKDHLKFKHRLDYDSSILKKSPPKTPARLSSPSPVPEDKSEMNFSSITLKKTRPSPSLPTKPKYSSTSEEKEPTQVSKVKLKPALPARKPSVQIPEALSKSKSLKPALPPRKPSYHIPEALTKSQTLHKSSPIVKPAEPDPEGLSKAKELKPAKPVRKPSVKELEALQIKNSLKKSSTGGKGPSNQRVFSNSKEILNNQLKTLKSVDNDNKPKDPKADHKLMLENVLKRSRTSIPSSSTTPTNSSFSSSSLSDSNNFKKASTFDSSQLSRPDSKLDHINKSRTKGPKRRTPKSDA